MDGRKTPLAAAASNCLPADAKWAGQGEGDLGKLAYLGARRHPILDCHDGDHPVLARADRHAAAGGGVVSESGHAMPALRDVRSDPSPADRVADPESA